MDEFLCLSIIKAKSVEVRDQVGRGMWKEQERSRTYVKC